MCGIIEDELDSIFIYVMSSLFILIIVNNFIHFFFDIGKDESTIIYMKKKDK